MHYSMMRLEPLYLQVFRVDVDQIQDRSRPPASVRFFAVLFISLWLILKGQRITAALMYRKSCLAIDERLLQRRMYNSV